MPGAPRMQIVPLPSPLTTTTSPALEDKLFPLDILLDIAHTQQVTILRSIILTTPVHVHGPITHLGMVHSDEPGQTVNALDVIGCLRAAFSQPVTRGVNIHVEITHTALI